MAQETGAKPNANLVVATAVVADDHETTRALIREILEDMGVKVLAEAANGQDAVQETLRLRPDFVTLDIRMPRLNGLAASKRIKTDAPQTGVFVVTNYPDEHYLRASKKAGADAFIAKPDAYEGLHEAVVRWRERMKESRTNPE